MKRIETPADLIQWANEINQTIGHMTAGKKADLQDVYARSTEAQIDAAFLADENKHARKLIVCSVNNIMAFEEVERLLNVLARHKCIKQAEIDEVEYQRRMNEIHARENAFREAQKPIHKKIRTLKDRIATLERHNEQLSLLANNWREQLNGAIHHANLFEKKAAKYDAIKKALED